MDALSPHPWPVKERSCPRGRLALGPERDAGEKLAPRSPCGTLIPEPLVSDQRDSELEWLSLDLIPLLG